MKILYGTFYWLLAASVAVALEWYEISAIKYSESQPNNPVSQLGEVLKKEDQEYLKSADPLKRLQWVLEKLKVPEETQTLVFSKTSAQTRLISPTRPRALYYNDDVYVGYVPYGFLEFVVADPKLGMVFYTMEPDKKGDFRFKRDASCLLCHGGGRSGGAPGLVMRSMQTDRYGEVVSGTQDYNVDSRTPYNHRWGGWYVTGAVPKGHLGNRVLDEELKPQLAAENIYDQMKAVPVDGHLYPNQLSEGGALLAFEHQIRVHNVMSYIILKFRQRVILKKTILNRDLTEAEALDLAKQYMPDLLGALFKVGDLKLEGEDIEVAPEFKAAFEALSPADSKGRSLRKFRSYERLLQYPLSYLVYSESFNKMPAPLRSAALAGIHDELTNKTQTTEISRGMKKRLHEILLGTHEEYFKRYGL